MSESVHDLHKNSTIYHFKLLRRSKHLFWLRYFPVLCIVATIPAAYLLLGTAVGAMGCLLMYMMMNGLYLGTVLIWQAGSPTTERPQLHYRWKFPWFGCSYKYNAALKAHRHLLLVLWVIPSAMIAISAPWLPWQWTLLLLIAHIELLWPRSFIIILFTARSRSGIVKIEDESTSLYAP